MAHYHEILFFAAGFALVAIASRKIAQYFPRFRLPLISGFLFTGILAGPHVLKLISHEALGHLRFADDVALAFIAFAAGGELYLKELSSRFRSIQWITLGQIVATFSLGTYAIYRLAYLVPFLQDLPSTGRIAVALLGGAILVARSPSSAIAMINELRAKGPFTQTILGVTVISDVVVIILFGISLSVSDALFTGVGLRLTLLTLLVIELLLSFGMGIALGYVLRFLLAPQWLPKPAKILGILVVGYGVFHLCAEIQRYTGVSMSHEISLEPLFVCMLGSFIVANYSKHRLEFLNLLSDIGPAVYTVFFTLTGAALALNTLPQVWKIAVILFLVRICTLFIGSFAGGALAGDPMKHNRLGWMAYVTQAGVGLGLAKEVILLFPDWGAPFATIMIAIIILSQVVGPPLFKLAFHWVGETHTRAETPEFDGTHDAIIFGLEGQSLALARHLSQHGWEVRIASRKANEMDGLSDSDVRIHPIADLSLDSLKQLEMEKADVIVAMLSDQENYEVCEMAYEHFGTRHMVVRLHDRGMAALFQELGALIVDPSSAIISLLFYFVRSPSAVSLLLGMGANQDILDLEVRNANLHGIVLRELRLPLDTLILSVRRRGRQLISHGYTKLEIGDWITVVGSPQSLEEVALRLS